MNRSRVGAESVGAVEVGCFDEDHRVGFPHPLERSVDGGDVEPHTVRGVRIRPNEASPDLATGHGAPGAHQRADRGPLEPWVTTGWRIGLVVVGIRDHRARIARVAQRVAECADLRVEEQCGVDRSDLSDPQLHDS